MTVGWAEPYAPEQKSPPEKRKAADNSAHKGTRTPYVMKRMCRGLYEWPRGTRKGQVPAKQ